MAPKRKSDVIDISEDAPVAGQSTLPYKENVTDSKKARLSGPDAVEASTSKDAKPKTWRDIVLDGEEEGDLSIYDDCNEIRRKIRLLQKTPGWKVTQWLRDIGNVNSNSYGRFMKASGPHGGAGNSTYYAAYIYFEKVRILEGKKKTAKRLRNEGEYAGGLPQKDRSRVWVFGPA